MTHAALLGLALVSACASGPRLPAPARIDAEAERLRVLARVPGVAVAVVDDGQVVHVAAFGQRDVERGLPLTTRTTMYGASLTKPAFAYTVLALVDEGVVDLDAPITRYLPRPLPEYEKYADLAGDARWEKLTARILLSHSAGFPNFRFLNEDGKLDFKLDPGTRYAYSGEGMNLLQFVLEKGLGLDIGAEMRRRVFERFGMTRTSMTWQDDFAEDLALGYDAAGSLRGTISASRRAPRARWTPPSRTTRGSWPASCAARGYLRRGAPTCCARSWPSSWRTSFPPCARRRSPGTSSSASPRGWAWWSSTGLRGGPSSRAATMTAPTTRRCASSASGAACCS